MACERHVDATESRAEAYIVIPWPSVVRFPAAGNVPNHSNERESRCVPLPRVGSGRSGSLIGYDPNQTSRWLGLSL